MILLDSNVLIDIFDARSARGGHALDTIVASGDGVGTTSINLHEVAFGVVKRSGNLEDLLRFPVLPYTRENAVLSSRIEAGLEKKGTAARRADAMIASIAIGASCPLYTFDRKHFEPMKDFGLALFG
jgi:predicted nucleic acid-binding protein